VTLIPASLVPTLGRSLEDLTPTLLGALVGVRESDYFEVKAQTYGNGDSAKRELCADIAAFANGRGGILLLGAADDDVDVVSALTPISLDGEELRIRQVVASGVFPAAPISLVVVPTETDPGMGFVVVAVPPSADGPHAVVKDQDLRFPVRSGAGKRYMSPPEVSDRFASRTAGRDARLGRLSEVAERLAPRLHRQPERAWLLIDAVADTAGRLPVSFEGKRETQKWLQELAFHLPMSADLVNVGTDITTGLGSYVAGHQMYEEPRLWSSAVAELHDDGAMAAAVHIGWPWNRGGRDEDATVNTISDANLATGVVALVGLAARHADRAGCSGNLHVVVSVSTMVPIELAHFRQHGIRERMRGTRTIPTTGESAHTFALTDLLDPTNLVAAASLAASGLMSAFGLAECLQLAPDGSVRRRYVEHDLRVLIDWAERVGVTVTEETLEIT
jgi:hypothetical protein